MHISRTIVAITAILLGPTYLLVAQPASNTGPIAVLLAAGDISYCNDTRADETARIIKHEIKAAREKDASVVIRVLALGDLAYKTGTAKQLECFRGHWGDFYDILLPAPGNHEYESTNRDGKPYFDHFKKYGAKVPAGGKTVPLVVQNGEQTGYYSVDLPSTKGAWRLISLNAYAGGTEPGKKGKEKRRKAMKAQMDWLSEQLASARTATSRTACSPFGIRQSSARESTATDTTRISTRRSNRKTQCFGRYASFTRAEDPSCWQAMSTTTSSSARTTQTGTPQATASGHSSSAPAALN
jgi:hypothetical protein